MKTVFKLILLLMIMGMSGGASAKSPDVKLVVTSDGATKDEAIKNALRSAIEQTYGVFVSANTDILNDDIVRDEIATVSSGNIKSYKELSCTEHDGKTNVTLEAVVSVGKLISYAKSKGAECELDFTSMFANLELAKLYEKNEAKAFLNVVQNAEVLLNDGYDYEMKLDVLSVKDIVTDRSAYEHFERTIDENNQWEDNAYLRIKVTARLNRTGEDAWNSIIDLLDNAYGTAKKDKHAILYSAKVNGTGPTSGSYGETILASKEYGVRSSASAAMVAELMARIPNIVTNIGLYNEDTLLYNLANEYFDFKKYISDDRAQDASNAGQFFGKKSGTKCADLIYYISIPLSEVKTVKKIQLKSNPTLPTEWKRHFDNYSHMAHVVEDSSGYTYEQIYGELYGEE